VNRATCQVLTDRSVARMLAAQMWSVSVSY